MGHHERIDAVDRYIRNVIRAEAAAGEEHARAELAWAAEVGLRAMLVLGGARPPDDAGGGVDIVELARDVLARFLADCHDGCDPVELLTAMRAGGGR